MQVKFPVIKKLTWKLVKKMQERRTLRLALNLCGSSVHQNRQSHMILQTSTVLRLLASPSFLLLQEFVLPSSMEDKYIGLIVALAGSVLIGSSFIITKKV